jgi:hypothetical protein
MLKKILFLFLLIITSSCSLPKDWNWGIRPRPVGNFSSLPSTDTIYGQGFREGCMAGWRAVSKGLLGDVKVKFDAQMMMNNKDYSGGWTDGYNYCVDTLDHDVP